MATNDLEEDILVAIDEDNIDEFIALTNKFKNWTEYLIKDEKEYFIHYALSKSNNNFFKKIIKFFFIFLILFCSNFRK